MSGCEKTVAGDPDGGKEIRMLKGKDRSAEERQKGSKAVSQELAAWQEDSTVEKRYMRWQDKNADCRGQEYRLEKQQDTFKWIFRENIEKMAGSKRDDWW